MYFKGSIILKVYPFNFMHSIPHIQVLNFDQLKPYKIIVALLLQS